MSVIIFYEKPSCAGNAKQRKLLEAAGHELCRRDMFTTAWTRDMLLRFLDVLPVSQWFNRADPRLKSGEVLPEGLTRDDALAMLLADPRLLRRPLLEREDGACLVGFELAEVDRFVGLHGAVESPSGSVEGCAAVLPNGRSV